MKKKNNNFLSEFLKTVSSPSGICVAGIIRGDKQHSKKRPTLCFISSTHNFERNSKNGLFR